MKISEREKEILTRLCLPNKVIAEQLIIAESTVKTHIVNLHKKFYWATNRTQLLFEALNHNIISIKEIITKKNE